MSDVVERLRLMLPKPGSSNGDVNAVVVATISDAVTEIENLRIRNQTILEAMISAGKEITRLNDQVADLTRIAGCVAVAGAVEVPVKTFDDIKREIRQGSALLASGPAANQPPPLDNQKGYSND